MVLNKRLTCIDLFAGCGGLSLGLEGAGFFPLFVNELNPDALETYLRNRDAKFPHLRKRFNSRDIKETIIDPNYYQNLIRDMSEYFERDFIKDPVDVLTGGPPCQGYSGIGIRRSYSVDKVHLPSNYLYQDMAYAIHKIKPKIFLFENVKGILHARWTKNGKKDEIFSNVLKTFQSIPDYKVRFKLVHAKDYGVPQNRPRVLVVGIHEDATKKITNCDDAVKAGFLPKPTNDYPHIKEIIEDLVDPEFQYGGETSIYPKPAKTKWQRLFRHNPKSGKVARQGTPISEHEYSNHHTRVIEKFSYMLSHDGEIPQHLRTKKFAQRVLPLKWGYNGPNITATSMPDDFVHYSQARTLTVREWARLQTFPDWYQFSGKRTTGGLRRAGNPREKNYSRDVPKYTQIGNAVPVKMSLELGKHFATLLS